MRNLTNFLDEITAHSQKVSCLDIGETGRVLVTGGHDRLVNLFAIGNEKSIQVWWIIIYYSCKKKSVNKTNKLSVYSTLYYAICIYVYVYEWMN